MYNFIRSFTKNNRAWVDNDLSAMTLADIIANYDDVRIIADFQGGKEIQIRVSSNKNTFMGHTQTDTLSQFLNSFTSDDLATMSPFGSLANAKCVDTIDLFQLPLESWRGNSSYGEGQTVPLGDQTDIAIRSTYDSTSVYSTENLQKNNIIAVNNTIVDTVMVDDVMFIKDGWRRTQLDNANIFTAIDFTDVGGIDKYSLSDITLTALTRNANDLANGITRVKATLPESMAGKTPILVIDGIFHLFDETYKEHSVYDIVINVHHIQATLQQVLRDRDPVGYINAGNVNEDGFDVDTFDPLAYLRDTVSMVVVIDNDDISILREMVGKTLIPNEYNHYRAPRGITVFEDKTYAPYMIRGWNEHEVELTVFDNEYRGFMYKTRDYNTMRVVNSTQESKALPNFRDCFVVEIYTLNV